jgi:hypothetical protein
MTKAFPRKPFYSLAEAGERWGLGIADVAAYVLEDELALSFPVAALKVEVSEIDHDEEGRSFSIPYGRRRHVGTLELHRVDAFNALTQGSATVTRFFSTEGEMMEPVDESGDRCAIAVECSALVVRHTEFERFEARQVRLPPPGRAAADPDAGSRRGRGAPEKYDWEGVLCAIIVAVNDEGVPTTQAEMIDKMRDWFERQLGSDNVPCDSSIKRRVVRFWDQIKPNVGRPSALKNISTVSRGGGRETARLGKP